ncbi:MAG: hypothetical protein ACKV19_16820 [Verrucomicrobiales bacterium]
MTDSPSPPLQLLVHAPGLHMDALLRPEALSEVLALIQKFRVEEASRRLPSQFASGVGAGFRPVSADSLRRRMRADVELEPLSPGGAAAMARFRLLAWESLTALLLGRTFATKLLLVTAWLEAHTGHPVFKGDVRSHFSRTGEPFPANPGRDTRTLIIDGFILKSQDRQHLTLSEAGWKEASQYLDGEGGEGDGVPVTA